MIEKVFEFLYNSDCCESTAHTMSIHRTREGAEKARDEHKENVKKKWEEENLNEAERERFPFNFDRWWGIRETELKD